MKTEKILRFIVMGGIFLLPFIPFIVAKSMFFPFIVGKNFAFRIIVEIIFAAWLLLVLRNPLYRPRFSWIAAAFAAFIGIITLADLFGADLFRSFWSNYERMEGLVTHLHLFAYFLVVGSMLRTRKQWGRLVHVSLFASVLMSLYALFQLWGYLPINQGGVRVDGTFGNATYLAAYLLLHIFFLIFLAVQRRTGRGWLFVYGGVLAMHLFVLINTQTRGAVLGLFAGLMPAALLIALFEKDKDRASLRKIAAGALVVLVLLVGGFFALRRTSFLQSNPVLSRFADLSPAEGKSRFMVWNMAWQGVKERPILGWGQDNFILVFNKYYNPHMYNQEPWFDRAHDIVFDWLIGAGFLGFVAYLSLFGAAIYYLFSSRRGAPAFDFTEKSIILGLLIAYFFQNIFVFDNIISYLLFFSLLAFIHSESANKQERVKRNVRGFLHNDMTARTLPALVFLGVLFALYSFNIKGILANRSLLRGLSAQERGGVAEDIARFKDAIDYHSFGTGETREQLVQFANSLASVNVSPDLKQKAFTLARDEMQIQVKETPMNARYRMFLATLLSQYSQYDDAIKEYTEAIKVSPKKQDFYYGLGNALINKREFALAVQATRTAFELAPENQQARKLYAASAIFAGQNDIAEKVLVPEFGTALIPETLFINAYAASKQYDKVAMLWGERVKGNPKDPQPHLGLAAAYFELGKKTESIAEIRKAIDLAPSFKQQGELYIQEIQAGKRP